jgi:choline dehydrogenase-like flavoprotein
MTIPSFQNYDEKTQRKDFIRGYVMNATGGQSEFPQYAAALPGYGSDWKREVKSRFVAQARVWNAGGEMLARKENFVELDPEVKDAWGIPVLKIHFTHSDNDYKLLDNFQQNAEELFRKAGGEVMPSAPVAPPGFPGGPGAPAGPVTASRAPGRGAETTAAAGRSTGGPEGEPPAGRGGAPGRRRPLGGSIHEVGTARMSVKPADGVLNAFCQTHDIANLYVFGGNAFPSTGDKHPTLTMMALTARGCDHLKEQAKGRTV